MGCAPSLSDPQHNLQLTPDVHVLPCLPMFTGFTLTSVKTLYECVKQEANISSSSGYFLWLYWAVNKLNNGRTVLGKLGKQWEETGRNWGRGWSRDRRGGVRLRRGRMGGDEERETEVSGSWAERVGNGWGEGYRCGKHPVELCISVCLCQHQVTGRWSNNKRTMLIHCLGWRCLANRQGCVCNWVKHNIF